MVIVPDCPFVPLVNGTVTTLGSKDTISPPVARFVEIDPLMAASNVAAGESGLANVSNSANAVFTSVFAVVPTLRVPKLPAVPLIASTSSSVVPEKSVPLEK